MLSFYVPLLCSNVDDAASNAKGEAKKGASKTEDAADDAAGSMKSGAKDAKKEVCSCVKA